LVHKIRSHNDFIKELDLVATIDNKIVGNIMYTKSRLIGSENKEIPVVSFGPVSVLPEYQRKGIGSELIIKTVEI
jgi:predicted N-acetyltransferase YhbS